MKRLAIGVVSLVVGLALLVFLVMKLEEGSTRRREARERSAKKIHVGDDRNTVRLRIGVPDTAYPGVGHYIWEWRSEYANEVEWWLTFDSTTDRVTEIAVAGREPWKPEDGLSFGTYSMLSMDDVRAKLGSPCKSVFSDDSTTLWHLFRLSPKERSADTVYASQGENVIRYFGETLKGNRTLIQSGWSGLSVKDNPCASKR